MKEEADRCFAQTAPYEHVDVSEIPERARIPFFEIQWEPY